VLKSLVVPRKFIDIVRVTGLSPSTVSKYIKFLKGIGFVRKVDSVYELTIDGRTFLRERMTRLVQEAFDDGVVDIISLVSEPHNIRIEKVGDNVVMSVQVYSREGGGVSEVRINFGDDVWEFVNVVESGLALLISGEAHG